MKLLSIFAKLFLDKSQFDRQMTGAEQRAGVFQQRFTRSLGQSMTRFVTVGFIGHQLLNIYKMRHEIEGVSEETLKATDNLDGMFKTVRDATYAFGLNRFGGEIRKVLALDKFLAMLPTVQSMLFGVKNRTVASLFHITDQAGADARVKELEALLEKAQKLKEQREKIAELTDKNNLSELTAEEKKLELTKRRMEIMRIISLGGMTKAQELDAIMKSEVLRGAILGIRGPKASADLGFTTISAGAGSLDPLARIGGFTGGDVRMVSYQERIARATERTAENTESDMSFS